ncbi:hypothetical protein K1X76_11875 [bacterium]|nr:hypothetical protein [bacterium]
MIPLKKLKGKLVTLAVIFICVSLSLVGTFFTELGGFKPAFDAVADGNFIFPAARGGPVILVFIVVVIFLWALALLSVFTIQGLVALIKGLVVSFVILSAFNIKYIKTKIPKSDPLIVKKWTGIGAVLAFVYCTYLGIINPLLSQLGSHPMPVISLSGFIEGLTEMGLMFCFVGYVIGKIIYLKNRSAQ